MTRVRSLPGTSEASEEAVAAIKSEVGEIQAGSDGTVHAERRAAFGAGEPE